MSLLGIDRDVLARMVETEGLPKPFVNDILKSLAESDVGMLVPYEFSHGDSAGLGPCGSEERLVLSSQGYENPPNAALTKPPS